jgi:hypothetical protein
VADRSDDGRAVLAPSSAAERWDEGAQQAERLEIEPRKA